MEPDREDAGRDPSAPLADWERIAPGVVRRRLPQWDATVGAVGGEDEVLVIDTGSSLREGAGIRADVRALLGRPATRIVLTHPHFDHVFGTAAFSGAQVYGAVGVGELLVRQAESLRDDAVAHGLLEDEAAEAADVLVPPHHPVCGELTLPLGGREAVLANLGPGHSGHDLAVLVPGSPDVVFCGDLVEESGEPQAGPDAHPARWPEALDRLLALGGEDAVYVPGHGALVDAAFVRAQRESLARRFESWTG
ncbi:MULTISPECIES: MBL fold metallo-hydrolase [unclassified Streptomyces]|uniref:MBL fold metallo-hydrolase n=1 Tax=unclassified Streptomyces TaxID=2593676 RepID=UPI002DD8FA0A|nr:MULTISPECIES: MBL fold metallo-hydrolase [unclassified Streptomyces]WSA94813.1 MBL fold metallo-hydrolase [Streptomyces sp. NBC_01795]WSB79234.1 MBL fold metallo-hydrolase [Streptomyces sp. NBC_01775]WSS12563.1 MBL fold metallo-hydrolase [Streptomyces sp. NBC_01186]WSS41349.1 MBL fold metallo-hydrolase [Streptomyces sp. NBC_01187]